MSTMLNQTRHTNGLNARTITALVVACTAMVAFLCAQFASAQKPSLTDIHFATVQNEHHKVTQMTSPEVTEQATKIEEAQLKKAYSEIRREVLRATSKQTAERRYRELRNEAFERDDIIFFKALIGKGGNLSEFDNDALLQAFHKARYSCVDVSYVNRTASQLWLIRNNVNTLCGTRVRLFHKLPIGDNGYGMATKDDVV